jgi:hypothetical protein
MRMSSLNGGWRFSARDVAADVIDDSPSSGPCAAPDGPLYALPRLDPKRRFVVSRPVPTALTAPAAGAVE